MAGNAGKGRPVGSKNKVTQDIRACIAEAFHKAGGVKYLLTVAKADPKTFCALVGKIVPTEIVGALTHYVAELPQTAPTVEAWQQQHSQPHQTVQ